MTFFFLHKDFRLCSSHCRSGIALTILSRQTCVRWYYRYYHIRRYRCALYHRHLDYRNCFFTMPNSYIGGNMSMGWGPPVTNPSDTLLPGWTVSLHGSLIACFLKRGRKRIKEARADHLSSGRTLNLPWDWLKATKEMRAYPKLVVPLSTYPSLLEKDGFKNVCQ